MPDNFCSIAFAGFYQKSPLVQRWAAEVVDELQKTLAKRAQGGQFLQNKSGWLPKSHFIPKPKGIFGNAYGINGVCLTPLQTTGFLDLKATFQPYRQLQFVKGR
jgi:hypothetical protein